MAAITLDIPDNLARYAAENGVFTPEWIAFVIKTSLDKLRKSQNAPKTGDAGRKIAAKDAASQKDPLLSRLRGCYAYTGDTLEAYFERKKADKEHELATESSAPQKDPDIERMRGCDAYTGDTLEAYFERKRADKEYELALEERQREESRRYARLSS